MITGNIHPDNHSGALSRPSSRYPAGRHSWDEGEGTDIFLRYSNFHRARKKRKEKKNQHTWDTKFPTRIVKQFFIPLFLFKHFTQHLECATLFSSYSHDHTMITPPWLTPSKLNRRRRIVFIASYSNNTRDTSYLLSHYHTISSSTRSILPDHHETINTTTTF